MLRSRCVAWLGCFSGVDWQRKTDRKKKGPLSWPLLSDIKCLIIGRMRSSHFTPDQGEAAECQPQQHQANTAIRDEGMPATGPNRLVLFRPILVVRV